MKSMSDRPARGPSNGMKPAARPGESDDRDASGTAALGPLPGYVGFNLRRAQSASFRHLDRAARDLDLTPGQFSLLTLLRLNPGISQKSVSQLFGVDTSTVSPVLEAMARRGLITRTRAENDRRTYALALTAEGERALGTMRRHVEAQETLMAAILKPGERDHLLDMLTRLTAALSDA